LSKTSISTRALLALALLFLLGAPGLALAQGGGPPEAKRFFREGKKAYAEGRFEEAAHSFAKGYALDPQPAFLLNRAQSERSAGMPGPALAHYREFLRVQPTTPLRPQVEELIRELEAEVGKTTPPRAAPPRVAPSVAVAASPSPPPPAPPGPGATPVYKTWWFWTVIGAVVVGTTIWVSAYAGTREPTYTKEGGLGSIHF
jgi:hypothetical protein